MSFVKINLSLLIMMISFSLLSQEKKREGLFQEDSTRCAHIIDFEFGEPGGVGYNFFYRPWSNVSFGARIGAWTRKSRTDIVPENSRRFLIVNYDLFADYRIWKSNYFELGLGYYNAWAWPTETNIETVDFPVYNSGFFGFRAGVKTFLFDIVMIRLAAKFQYDLIPEKWYVSPSFSLGYKF